MRYSLIVLSSLLAACSDNNSDGGGGGGDGGGSGGDRGAPIADGPKKNKGQNPFGKGIDTGTGVAQVDQLIAAAATCGYQSWSTVPPGWKMVLTGEKGCAVWAPPTWTAAGAGTAVTSIEEPPDGASGALVMGGVPPVPIDCTPKGASEYVVQNIEADGCTGAKTLYYKEGTEVIAGISIPKADHVIGCNDSGIQVVGYMWVTIQGTAPLCNMLVMGFWMPEGQIAARTCTLTQVIQSARCPQPGGTFCVDADCQKDCVASGSSGGRCVDDSCVCN